MKTLLKSILSLVFSIMMSQAVNGQAYELTSLDVVVTAGVIESCSYDFSNKDIIIPDELDGQTITEIGSSVFYETDITSVQLPTFLETIETNSFSFNSLTSIIIPNNVIEIHHYAFIGNSLSSLFVPNSVKIIDGSSFTNLSEVIFEENSNIEAIGDNAFTTNASLTSFILPTHANETFIGYKDENNNFYNEGDVITDLDVDYYAIIAYVLTDDDVVVNNGIIESCSYNFSDKEIIIEDELDGQTVTGIADDVFVSKGITFVQLPSTLKHIGDNTFSTNNIFKIDFPNSLITIGNSAIADNLFTSITIPSSVTFIGNSAFHSNANLTSVTFEDNSSIQYIGTFAFNLCDIPSFTLPTHKALNFTEYKDGNGNVYADSDIASDLETAYYSNPYTITDADVNVVDGMIDTCSYDFYITDIIIPNTLDGQEITRINSGGINVNDNSKGGGFNTNGITSVELPSKLDTLGDDAFSGNSISAISLPNTLSYIGFGALMENSITGITIPDNVTFIGNSAFWDNSISTVAIPGSVTTIEGWAFADNNLSSVTFDPNSNIGFVDGGAFTNNPSLASATLPTHASANFQNYIDGNAVPYIEGGVITDFDISYTAVITPYTVIFNDYNGTELKTEAVAHGNSATAPTEPTRSNYTFLGWDIEFGNITSDLTVTAQYTPISYNITYNLDDGSNDAANPDDYTVESSTITLADASKVGYSFAGWYGDDTYTEPSKVTEITLGSAGDVELWAKFTINTYTITYNLDDGSNDAANPDDYTVETSTITFANAAKNGYSFAGWYSDDTYITQVTEITLGSTGDVELWAKFTINTYSITYNLNDGSNDAANPVDYTVETSTITLENAAKNGYSFAGWYSDDTYITPVTEITLGSTGDVELWAKFTINTYTITYNLDDGSNDAANPDDYTVETSTITFANAAKNGYSFAGWYSDDTYITQVTEITLGSTGDVELWAKFTINTYTITYNLDDGSNDAANPVDYTVETSTITLENAAKNGYSFAGWYSDDTYTTPVTEITLGSTGDVELWAKFTINTYTITYNLDDGSNDAANPVDYTVETSTITLENAAKNGYSFAGWYSDDTYTTPVTEITLGNTGDVELWAKFSINTYTITYNLDDGSNNAANPVDYTVETSTITLADASKVGYSFAGWYSDDTYTTPVTEITLGSTGDVELWAKFTINTYTITYNLDGGTNDAANPVDYTVETSTITLENAAKNGYSFAGWYSDDTYTTPITEITLGSTGDVELWAKFTISTYTITYNLDGGTNDAANPVDYTVETSTITLENAAKNGYSFAGWYSDDTYTTPVTELTLGSTDDVELWAKFTINTYTITYNLDDGSNDAANPVDYTVETSTITLENATKNGYSFAGWYSDDTYTEPSKVTEITLGSTGDFELWAKFTINTYTITYNLDDGSNDAVNPVDYTVETSTITLENAAKNGYSFAGWYSDDTYITPVTEITLGSTGDVELWAKFTVNTYTVTYNLDDGSNDAANPVDYTVETSTITLKNATKEGNTFEGWYSDDTYTTTVTEITLGSTGDVELWAKFTISTYTITYNLDGGTNDAANSVDYTIETSTITLENAAKNGYSFAGWYSDNTYTTPVTEITLGSTGDVELWAKFTVNTYTVTYNLDEGANDAANPVDYTIETSTITLENATKEGNTFEGWYSDDTYITRVTEITLGSTGNIELWAKFNQTYSITYNLDGGANDAANPVDYSVETSTITLENAAKNGYSFVGWYSDDTYTTPVTEITLGSSGDLELWAKFTINTYTITYNLDGGTNDTANPVDYSVETSTITLENATKNGYSFAGWYSDNTYTTQVSEITLGSTDNVELWAKFSTNTYTITYNLDGGTNNAANPDDYTIETPTTTLEDASKEEYAFKAWYSDAAYTIQVTEITLGSTGDIELWAKFNQTYSISFTVSDGSSNIANATVNINGQNYTTNTSGEVTVNNMEDGSYNYKVTAEGYEDITGNITITGANIDEAITMTVITGVNNIIANGNFKIYPNPATDFIVIVNKELKNENCEILDITGRIVKQLKIKDKKSTIQISDLESGIYFLKVDKQISKFIKK